MQQSYDKFNQALSELQEVKGHYSDRIQRLWEHEPIYKGYFIDEADNKTYAYIHSPLEHLRDSLGHNAWQILDENYQKTHGVIQNQGSSRPFTEKYYAYKAEYLQKLSQKAEEVLSKHSPNTLANYQEYIKTKNYLEKEALDKFIEKTGAYKNPNFKKEIYPEIKKTFQKN